jgi:hypothetical protein
MWRFVSILYKFRAFPRKNEFMLWKTNKETGIKRKFNFVTEIGSKFVVVYVLCYANTQQTN